MKKFILAFLLYTLYSILHTTSVHAALVTINPKGQIVWQVLGDSTFEVKKVAQNTSASELALTSDNGKIMLNGSDVSNLKEPIIEIESRPNSNDLKISGSDGKFTIEENGVIAETSFPITIDSVKNELTVKTPSGDRLIAILPQEAVQSLLRANYITSVNNNKINLEESDKGELQYKVSALKAINLFNIANINAPITSNVSATTGEVLKLDEPQWLRLFGFVFNN